MAAWGFGFAFAGECFGGLVEKVRWCGAWFWWCVRGVDEKEEDGIQGLLRGYVESGGALRWVRERRGERIWRGALERDIVMEIGLWAMVCCFVWKEERCGERMYTIFLYWWMVSLVSLLNGGMKPLCLGFFFTRSLSHCVGDIFHAVVGF